MKPNPPNDGGNDGSVNPHLPNDGGNDGSVNPPPPKDGGQEGGVIIHVDAGPDSSAGACFDHCDATYPGSASSAQLILSNCCGGPCASACPSGSCFGMSGIFGQPEARHICQSCAVGPLKAGTCGTPPNNPPDEFDKYQSCLKACH